MGTCHAKRGKRLQGGRGSKSRSDRSLELIHARPEFSSSALLANNQPVCLPPAVKLIWIICFRLFQWSACKLTWCSYVHVHYKQSICGNRRLPGNRVNMGSTSTLALLQIGPKDSLLRKFFTL